jgi:hypothetical protein
MLCVFGLLLLMWPLGAGPGVLGHLIQAKRVVGVGGTAPIASAQAGTRSLMQSSEWTPSFSDPTGVLRV